MAKKKKAQLNNPRKKDPTVKVFTYFGAFVGVAYMALMWLDGLPGQATMSYGLCKTYVEMQLNYPSSIEMVQVRDFVGKVNMDYRYTDVYGQVRTERTTCKLARDKQTGLRKIVSIVRKELNRGAITEDKERLDLFNKSIPGILANQELIDLTIPHPLSEDFKDYKR